MPSKLRSLFQRKGNSSCLDPWTEYMSACCPGVLGGPSTWWPSYLLVKFPCLQIFHVYWGGSIRPQRTVDCTGKHAGGWSTTCWGQKHTSWKNVLSMQITRHMESIHTTHLCCTNIV